MKEYKNEYSYELPIKIGTEVFLTICMGCLYKPEEIDKFSGWKVSMIRITEDDIKFEIRKGDSMEGFIPLKYLGKCYFLTKEDAIDALNNMWKMEADGTLDEYLDNLYND